MTVMPQAVAVPGVRAAAVCREIRFEAQPMRRLAALILAVAIPVVFVAALVPRLAPPGQFGFDKFLHAVTFVVLAGLVVIAGDRPRTVWVGQIGLVLFGATIEIAQSFVPGRSGSLLDWVGDSVGILVGGVVATMVWRRVNSVPR